MDPRIVGRPSVERHGTDDAGHHLVGRTERLGEDGRRGNRHRAQQPQLRCVRAGQLVREQRRMTALRVADRHPLPAGVGGRQPASGADAVDHAVGLTGPREVRVPFADGAEPDVVGGHVDALDAEAGGARGGPARCARRRQSGGAVGPRRHRPAVPRRPGNGIGDDAGDGAVASPDIARVVHHPNAASTGSDAEVLNSDERPRLPMGKRMRHPVEVGDASGEVLGPVAGGRTGARRTRQVLAAGHWHPRGGEQRYDRAEHRGTKPPPGRPLRLAWGRSGGRHAVGPRSTTSPAQAAPPRSRRNSRPPRDATASRSRREPHHPRSRRNSRPPRDATASSSRGSDSRDGAGRRDQGADDAGPGTSPGSTGMRKRHGEEICRPASTPRRRQQWRKSHDRGHRVAARRARDVCRSPEPLDPGCQRHRLRLPRRRCRCRSAGAVAALPRQPRQLGPGADRPTRRATAGHHVRQRRCRGLVRLPADTIEQMAHDAIVFITALELERVDILGFSIGSFVAQEITLSRPNLVRRLILASSAPKGSGRDARLGARGHRRGRRTSTDRRRRARRLLHAVHHRAARPADSPSNASTAEPRTATPRPRGRHDKPNTTPSAGGESPTTPCWRG